MFVYQGQKIIGSYAAAMGGVDVIVFTAGIGENTWKIREEMIAPLEFMGARIDPSKNTGTRTEAVISADDSKVKVVVIPTNEELAIAQETQALIG